MTPGERRATASLASVYSLRLFGMFVILPVFALYAERLPGGESHTLVGIALGIYGLTQAILQIPFGWASDRWGRKEVIYSGLVILAIGSAVAAVARDIQWVIIGRALQGAGAISAAAVALVADLTRDAVRTTAMAVIGISIGATFALSLVVGPMLDGVVGVPGIFALTGILALVAIVVVRFGVPDPDHTTGPASVPGQLVPALLDRQLLRLSYGTFTLHAVLMALFTQVPFALRDSGLADNHHWWLYLPVLVIAVAAILPFLRRTDRPGQAKPAMVAAIAVLFAGTAGIAWSLHSVSGLAIALTVFFAGFNLLEALLPSLVSKYAAVEGRGAAIGVNSSAQFLGAFVGAAAAGWLAEHVSNVSVFVFCLVLVAFWFVVALTMAHPDGYVSNYTMGET
ncbi:MAG: MFS transporter [Burkholderiales bacterium]|nr:MFS transporter [Burkholderiales bacterium]